MCTRLFPAVKKSVGLSLLSLSTPNSSAHTPPHLRDPPGSPLAHPPLMLGLLVVVLIVAVVPPPGRCCNHRPGLARGVVGAVFCTGAGQRGGGHFGAWPCFSLQDVWRQQPDTSRGSCAHPQQYLLFPTLMATPGRGPQETTTWHWRAEALHMILASTGGSEAQRAEGLGPGLMSR